MATINIEKRHLFFIIGVIVFFAGVGLVISYNENWKASPRDPSIIGHSPDEVYGLTRCDWQGWDDVTPWKGGKYCENTYVTKNWISPQSKNIWKDQGSCQIDFPKGYHCNITVGGATAAENIGTYKLHCWTSFELHGEWTGENDFSRFEFEQPSVACNDVYFCGVKVEYNITSGEWVLTAAGKNRNQGAPFWIIQTCSAGGYKNSEEIRIYNLKQNCYWTNAYSCKPYEYVKGVKNTADWTIHSIYCCRP